MPRGLRIITREGESGSLPFDRAIIALGTFDGVHTAHKALLGCAVELAEKKGARTCAWCFSQNPAAILKKGPAPMLTSLEEKVRLLLCSGADAVAVADFEEFRALSAADFISEVLRGELCGVGAVCGFNHRFGRGGEGVPALLKEHFGEDNTCIIPKMEIDGETVSSSAIRSHIEKGEVERAGILLGRAFSLCAEVKPGKRLGRSLGFPTANIDIPEGTVTPKRGIYAVRCTLENGEKHIGVANIGVRPTVEDGVSLPNCETYIIGYSGELYGQALRVEFHKYLREEMKFSDTDSLSRAIGRDRESAERYFSEKRDGRDVN